jgi:phage FluMu protein Com
MTSIMPKCPYCNEVLHLRNMLYAPKSKDDKPDPIETVLLDKSKAHLWACPHCDKIIAITEIPR